MFLSDQYEELSLREQDAARALKSALIGVFFFPLQLYTSFLVLMVAIAEVPLRPRYFWYTVMASLVLAVDIPFSVAMLFIAFYL